MSNFWIDDGIRYSVTIEHNYESEYFGTWTYFQLRDYLTEEMEFDGGGEIDVVTNGMWICRDDVGNPIATYYLETPFGNESEEQS